MSVRPLVISESTPKLAGLVGLERRIADLERLGGVAFEEFLLLGGEGFVVPRAHPDRGALEHRQVRGVPAAISGTYWMALAPVPIDATRSPAVDFE